MAVMIDTIFFCFNSLLCICYISFIFVFLYVSLFRPSVSLSFSFICSMVIMKTACEREEDSFMLVFAMALDLVPIFISSSISCGLTTAHSETPSTYTPFLGSSLI